ncbi:MAG: hypothetical protein JWM64_2501 [Frankiales bacterium]|nr:hypothetical protein [Frankiales bacterium]
MLTADGAAAPRTTPPRAARRIRQTWAELAAPTVDPVLFDPSLVAALPEPARRWLTHAIAPGTPLWQSVEVCMAGEIRLGSWYPFTAVQVVSPEGYVWAADTRVHHLPVLGYDRLSGGTGEMRWRALDLVPVVSVTGPDVTRSAAGRLASEVVLLPTSFRTARWSAAGPDTAVASWGEGAELQRVELLLDDGGGLREVFLQRWGDPTGLPFGRYPFGVTVEQEQTSAGVTVPSVFTAGWHRRTDRQAEGEFFRAHVTALSFR